jgi:hypothetical protein
VRLVVTWSAVVGVALLAVGVLAFVRTGHDWVVLALTWCFGLFHLVLLPGLTHSAAQATGRDPSRVRCENLLANCRINLRRQL